VSKGGTYRHAFRNQYSDTRRSQWVSSGWQARPASVNRGNLMVTKIKCKPTRVAAQAFAEMQIGR